MKVQCVYLTPDSAKTIKFYSTSSRMIHLPHVQFNYVFILLLLIHHAMFISLILSLCLFSSHWPALAGAVFSSHSDSVFADQTQDHRKVSSFPSLFYLFLWLFSLVFPLSHSLYFYLFPYFIVHCFK